MDSKYYAYYVSKHKPLLMNDIKEQLKAEYGGINRSLIVEQVEANLYLNDWNMYLNETIHNQCLNSLVLVKFTLVNDIFIKNNEIDRVKYKEVIKNKEVNKLKFVKRDYSHYKLREILFSGTQKLIGERNNEDGNNVSSDDSNINYIFTETIIINLDNILNYYIGLTFDSNRNSNKENKFSKQLNHYLKNGEIENNYIYNILQLTNNIVSKFKFDSPYENYQHLREYIPLIITEASTNIIKSIWDDIYKQPDDPYEFIKNHKLITTTEDIVIDYSKPNNQAIQNIQNNQNPLYIIKCPIHSKLYMTTKKFSDINYQDALPFRAFFTTKETTLSNIDKKHNSVLEKISYIEAKIANINRAKVPSDYNLRIQNNDMITSLKNDIVLLKTQLYKINPYYKQHILFNSPVGYRLTYQHTLDKFSSLLYLRYVCNNKSRLNNNFLFSYSPIDNTNNNNIENDNENNIINNIHQQHNLNFHNLTYDIMSLYVSKELINDIISLKTVADIFTISRFFKISMDDKYNETGFETSRAQNSYEYEYNPSTKALATYIKNNIALDLFNYQQNNVLWMLKIEDDIDSHNLTVNSYVGKFEINYDHIEDIKIFIYNLRARVPEAILKNYVIMHNGRKHVIDIRQTATIAQSASIMSLLNTDYYRGEATYDFESNIIEKIVPIDDYIKSHSKPIELCGGALCDEVGLGKTLSIISHLVVKMQHDMYKYSRYQNKMKEVVEQIKVNPKMHFDDPLLDYGFEFNNLIIVPSRLTSQWESEIEKYVKNKFNLRAKVLVGIASVKILEKELHEFYNKKKKDIKKDNKKTTHKEDIKINKKSIFENIDNNNDIEIKPIIDSKVNLDVNINIDIKIKENDKSNNDEKPIIEKPIIEKPIEEKPIEEKPIEEKPIEEKPIKKTKEQLMIEKLMKNAKKANDKIRDGKKSKDESIKNIITIPTTTTKSKTTTFDSLFNPEDEIIKPIETIPTSELPQNIVPNQYEFLNKYLDIEDINTHNKAYKEDQLYDIYIVSLNLLSNENYLNHILHNPANHFSPYTENTNTNNNTNNNNEEANLFKNKKIINLYKEPRQICRYTDKFNIFKIKWNRVILDEAHEQLAPVIKMFSTSIKNYLKGSARLHLEDQILFENLCIINSNYKWAMTGTPSEKGIDNIMGILQFLTKKNYSESFLTKIEKIRYMSDIIGIAKPNMDSLLSRVFKKTLKKDVKALLNIPIFTEDIIFVEQTNIERNIYNTIRCSTHFNEATKIRRLFLMCTNILINEGYDLDNNNEITTEILTLEQLNANMIGKFNQQLKQLGITETRTVQQIENLIVHIQDWIKIYTYIDGLHLDERVINREILKEIKERFSELDRPGIRNQAEIFYSVLNIFECWNNLENIGNVLLTNISMIKDYLNRIWRVSWNQTWNDEIVLTKCAEYGARLGEIRANEELVKARKALDGINNDKRRINNQISLFSSNEFIKEKTADPCIICFEDLNQIVVTPCRHVFCLDCIKRVSNDLKTHFTCPECRTAITCNTLNITSVEMIKNAEKKKEEASVVIESTETIKAKIPKTAIEKKLGIDWKAKCVNKYGSKMAELVEYLYKLFENKQNKCIIFSQYDKMLRMIGITLEEFDIKFVYCHGNNYVVNKNINKFKKDESIRVIMLSSESSNSGSNLTEANNIIFIDVLFNNCETVKAIETQAIGRAVRLGQKLPVKIIRFITKGTVEEEHFNKNKYDINSLQS